MVNYLRVRSRSFHDRIQIVGKSQSGGKSAISLIEMDPKQNAERNKCPPGKEKVGDFGNDSRGGPIRHPITLEAVGGVGSKLGPPLPNFRNQRTGPREHKSNEMCALPLLRQLNAPKRWLGDVGTCFRKLRLRPIIEIVDKMLRC